MQTVQRGFNNTCCIQYLRKRNFKHFSVQNPERKKWRGVRRGFEGILGLNFGKSENGGGVRRGFEANRIIHTILQKTTEQSKEQMCKRG